MIRSVDLSFSYGRGKEFHFPDIAVGADEACLILGESGCGKTTLLQLLAGLRKPQSGQVWIQDQDLHQLSGSDQDLFRGRHIGLVFQTPHFLQALNIRQNIALAQKLAGQPVDYEAVDRLLDRLGIRHCATAMPKYCSQGEQQRASIARALINTPALLMADEPTSALDDRHCEEVLTLLEEHTRDAGTALLIVTHDQRLKGRIAKSVTLSAHA
jgi:ABC-type lipoprotein export system ATPase subunit